jgi:hypothetical protein
MASADSCPLTRHVAMLSAVQLALNRLVGQVSPDKFVNCRCTTAAFTLLPKSAGFVMLC